MLYQPSFVTPTNLKYVEDNGHLYLYFLIKSNLDNKDFN